MARKTRSTELETRAARLRLPIRKKPYAVRIAPGIRLAYRRNETAGSWSVIVADGAGSNWMKSFGLADDHEEANGGDRVMDFWRAQDRARTLASGSDGSDDGRPVTVTEALDRYAADLAGRDGDGENVSRVRFHVPPSLASKSGSLLTARELRHWRDGMIKNGLKPATVKRTAKPLIAALNLAASLDPRITNGTAWKIGLASLPDSEVARNVVLPEDTIRKLVGLAYADSAPFGLLVEVAAVTGARVSQLRRLEVRDLIAGHRVMMPSSLKGKGTKRITRSPVPITPGLTVKLKAASAGRPEDAPLLLKADGNPWNTSGHSEPFRRIVMQAGLDPSEVTIYSLRHSSITRQLVGGTPIRVVAVTHDTSIQMIEATYSRHIGDHSDALIRRNMLDLSEPPAGNVVPIR
jgi:integrase